MEPSEKFDVDEVLQSLDTSASQSTPEAAPSARAKTRDITHLLRKIPVTLTLEVGSADVTLADLARIHQGSVVELDKLAGEPLDIKVNGTLIGRAEVVVSGENYGLRVVELDNFDFNTFTS